MSDYISGQSFYTKPGRDKVPEKATNAFSQQGELSQT